MQFMGNTMKSQLFMAVLVLSSSDSARSSCPECEGDSALSCRLVSGLFTRPHLSNGHAHVTSIPQGACRLNVTLLRPSANRIAVRGKEGKYLINGPGVETPTGLYEEREVGVTIFYSRGGGDRGREQLLAEGPLARPLTLELLVSEPNRGVEYRYIYPLDKAPSLSSSATELPQINGGRQEASVPQEVKAAAAAAVDSDDEAEDSHRSRHAAKYSWTLKTLTVCSRSCGGGYQTTVAVCIKAPLGKVVPDQRCSAGARPATQTLRCNRNPCPARWSPGPWGPCSVSCGDASGTQERRFTCRQELSPTMSVPVAERACLEPAPQGSEVRRRCLASRPCPTSAGEVETAVELMAMEQPERAPSTRLGRLKVEGSSVALSSNNATAKNRYLDAFVGTGIRRRQSEAAAAAAGGGATEWVAQPWGPCSVSCGAGVKERRVHCADTRGGLVEDSRCRALARPDSEAYCEGPPCTGDQWLTSDWDACSAHCGTGEKQRRVVCLSGDCREFERPADRRPCLAARECTAEWFTGRWSVCSASCGEGRQTREVLCALAVPAGGPAGGGHLQKLVGEELCATRKKPRDERSCHIQDCREQWFTTPWTQCSASCGEGERSRQAVCLEGTRASSLCRQADKPHTKESCQGPCMKSNKDKKKSDVDEEEEEEEEEEKEEEDEKDEADYEEEEGSTSFLDVKKQKQPSKEERESGALSELNTDSINNSHQHSLNDSNTSDKDSKENESDNNSDIESSSSIIVGMNNAKSSDVESNSEKNGSDVESNDILPTSKPGKLVKGPGCQDKFKNCNIVVQSRLCMYSFYQTNCCRSCSLTLP